MRPISGLPRQILINLVTIKNIKWVTIIAIAALILGGLACINGALSEMPDIEATVEIRLLEEKAVLATVEVIRQQSSSKQQHVQPDQSVQSTGGLSKPPLIIPPAIKPLIFPLISTPEVRTNQVPADATVSIDDVPTILPTLELLPEHDPYHHLDQAQILLDAGQNKHAISKLTRAINLFPEHGAKYASYRGIQFSSLQTSKWLFLRGQTYYEIAQYNAAISDFDQALKLSPSYAEAQFHIGKSMEQLAQARSARLAFDQACLLDYRWCTRSTVLIPPQAIPTITPTPLPVPTPTTPYIPPTPTPRPGYCSEAEKTNPHIYFGVAGEKSIIEARLGSITLATTTSGWLSDYQLTVPVCDSSGKSLHGSNIHFKVNGTYAVNARGEALTGILSVGSSQKMDLCGSAGVGDC